MGFTDGVSGVRGVGGVGLLPLFALVVLLPLLGRLGVVLGGAVGLEALGSETAEGLGELEEAVGAEVDSGVLAVDELDEEVGQGDGHDLAGASGADGLGGEAVDAGGVVVAGTVGGEQHLEVGVGDGHVVAHTEILGRNGAGGLDGWRDGLGGGLGGISGLHGGGLTGVHAPGGVVPSGVGGGSCGRVPGIRL